MDVEETNIIEEIINGNQRAFHEFYHQWDERVYHYFLKKTRCRANAKDLTQQTFIKFWKYRKLLSVDHTLEMQLLHKARLIFIDWMRKEVTQKKRYDAAIRFYQGEQSSQVSDSRSYKIENALEQLPYMRRKVIELSHIHGYKYKEIADELHISVKTVDNHVHQALKQLRKYLSCLFIFF